MKERQIKTKYDLEKAALDLLRLEKHLPLVLTLTEGNRLRTPAQNARHWSDIDAFMTEINQSIEYVSEHTGYTPLEVKRLLASELPIEHAVILFARSKETVHDVLKDICNIPSSTRLGTKAFSKFDDILAQTMSEIIGSVKAFTRRAA